MPRRGPAPRQRTRAGGVGDADIRDQAPGRTRSQRGCFVAEHRDRDAGSHGRRERREHNRVGMAGELHGCTGEQCPDAQPSRCRASDDHRAEALALGRRQLDDGCRERAGGHAGCKSLDHAASDHPADVRRDQEDQHRGELDDQCPRDDRAPAEVITQRARSHQRREQRQRVGREGDGEYARRKAPLVLVLNEQRRGRARREEQASENGRGSEEGRPGR